MAESLFQECAFVSLGANLDSSIGSPAETVRYAITLLVEFSTRPLLISTLLESDPVDCPPGSPKYINAVVGLYPARNETAHGLLTHLQEIEQKVGRTRSGVVNEARVLDLDLVTFKTDRYQTERLTLPHPRASQRLFVLQPLRELVGNVVFPESNNLMDNLITCIIRLDSPSL